MEEVPLLRATGRVPVGRIGEQECRSKIRMQNAALEKFPGAALA